MPFRLHARIAIAIAFIVPFALLLATVRTQVGFWDTGDLQTVAWIGGIPYPTGYPGYVMLAWMWAHVIPLGSVAARVNALSALAVAAGAATIAWIALVLRVVPVIAVLAAWTFAFAHVVWVRATYADVHPLGFTIALNAIALAVLFALRGGRRALVLGIVLGGVALAFDSTTILMLLGGLIAALARPWPARAALRAFAIGALIVVIAYAYLPLRSLYVTAHRLDPTLAIGVEPGRPFWDDHHPSTAAGFDELVFGTEWGTGTTLLRLFTPASVATAYARFADDVTSDMPQGLAFVALVGLGFIAAEAPLVGLGLAVAALLPALFGGSYRAEADPERYVFMLYALVALGVGVAADRTVRAFGRTALLAPCTIACAFLVAVIARDGVHARDIVESRDDPQAAELGARVDAVTRPGAIVVAPWDWATPLAYRAYVERRLDGRVVLCALAIDHLDEYAQWMRSRQVAVVNDGPPDVPGYRARRLTAGTPQVYELLPP